MGVKPSFARLRQNRGLTPRDLESGEVPRENRVRSDPALGQFCGPDHAHADAVPRPVTAEAVRLSLLPKLECGALDVLPAQRSADDDAKILAGDDIRTQTIERQLRDAS